MIHTGDCVQVMAQMDAASVDAIVTDPPYGLEFMGKEWDRLWGKVDGKWADRPKGGTHPFANLRPPYGMDSLAMQAWHQAWATEALRVAKPGAYLLAFGGTRTVHRLTVALEDAGWIVRDVLCWVYASGFPKSKASLKPAWEPIVLCRKPGPLRELGIDAARIAAPEGLTSGGRKEGESPFPMSRAAGLSENSDRAEEHPAGRWPANVVLTDPAFDGDRGLDGKPRWDGVVGGGEASYNPAGAFGVTKNATGRIYGDGKGVVKPGLDVYGYGDTGTYSRFFILPKASRSDREPVLPGTLEEREQAATYGDIGPVDGNPRKPDNGYISRRRNVHPTVKPTELMQHLIRLVSVAGDLILDPFLGSGTTAIAAELEGRRWIGIEREPDYVAIAEQRLKGTQRGMGLEVPA